MPVFSPAQPMTQVVGFFRSAGTVENKDFAAYGIPGTTGMPPGFSHMPFEHLL